MTPQGIPRHKFIDAAWKNKYGGDFGGRPGSEHVSDDVGASRQEARHLSFGEADTAGRRGIAGAGDYSDVAVARRRGAREELQHVQAGGDGECRAEGELFVSVRAVEHDVAEVRLQCTTG